MPLTSRNPLMLSATAGTLKNMDTHAIMLPVLLLIAGAATGLAVGWVLGTRSSLRARDAAHQQLQKAITEKGRAEQERAAAQEAVRLYESRVQNLEQRADQDHDVLRALGPLSDRMRTIQEHVTRLERDRAQQFGDLSRALKTAQQTDRELQKATSTLENSLRSTSARGTWGEMQLRRVVEAAGMIAHVDFAEQVHLAAEHTTVRPDMVVNLPGHHTIVVDAKAPLDAFLNAQHEGTPQAGLKAHAKAVRTHVDALSKKKYWQAVEHSPTLVLCFIPMESALGAALESDPTLLEHAASRNIALVSPVSLLACLKAIAFSWRQESLAQDATELLRLSKELYERLGSMGAHLGSMGASLRRSVEHYNEMVGSLERRVLPTARKLNDLDPTITPDPRLNTVPVETQPRAITAPELTDTTKNTGKN